MTGRAWVAAGIALVLLAALLSGELVATAISGVLLGRATVGLRWRRRRRVRAGGSEERARKRWEAARMREAAARREASRDFVRFDV